MGPVDPRRARPYGHPSVPSRPVKRRDALENQARIIAAAHEVFSERGIDAPIPEIAARAGVGKATVYRSFPTKADLIAAIATRRLETVRDAARRALETADPWLAVLEMTAEVLLL